ncbi:MAG: beta-ketoacyl synthase N-terminal-like domain-containing protein [Chloroflexota bacterium]
MKGMPKRTPRLGRGVALVGAGMSKFGVVADKSGRDLFVEAFQEMQASVDKGLDVMDIEALYLGNYSSDLFEGQCHTAPIMADWVGLVPKPATRIEGACASGGVALREGIIAIASGLYDVVLVGGMEKMTNLSTEKVTDALAVAGDMSYEFPAGFTFPGLYAAMATAYMGKYGAQVEHFMKVGIKNHNNGALNPKAQFNSTIKDIMEGRMARAKQRGQPVPTWADEMSFLHDPQANPVVAWPMRLFDCSPITDGAACLLLVSEELAQAFSDNPIDIIGSGQASDHALHERPELTSIASARIATKQAYDMAGVKPQDVQIAEVHDCFTIAEILATEDLGFFRPGEGFKAVEEGVTARDGAKPVNTSGGLKAKGHPVGASGCAQVVEIWHQMRGTAGPRQVPGQDIHLALTHNVGGTGGTSVVHIFHKR